MACTEEKKGGKTRHDNRNLESERKIHKQIARVNNGTILPPPPPTHPRFASPKKGPEPLVHSMRTLCLGKHIPQFLFKNLLYRNIQNKKEKKKEKMVLREGSILTGH